MSTPLPHMSKNVNNAVKARLQKMDKMRGRAHKYTVETWSCELGVGLATVKRYARDLGETCKPSEKIRLSRAKQPNQHDARDTGEDTARMMAEWATRPIR